MRNAAWLKEHAGDRFYIEGYASSDGLLGYNLTLSNRRADWVKQALISKGIAENRIVLASPWGQLYPACAELDEACWSKNRGFVYSPHETLLRASPYPRVTSPARYPPP
jgi:outer membrane protein OmpA-like peptidoglycan-associated protein